MADKQEDNKGNMEAEEEDRQDQTPTPSMDPPLETEGDKTDDGRPTVDIEDNLIPLPVLNGK